MTLDQWFDADALACLREAVLAEAVALGMPRGRADDVVLAVHELAANAVRHGGGTGRVQVQVADGALHCQVSDFGQAAAEAPVAAAAMADLRPWQLQHGHGLWLVRSLADRLAIAPSAAGSQVTAVFTLPEHGHRAAQRTGWD
jgi:anti-sigma regulatory factor (Ser/Thr protein kinase)